MRIKINLPLQLVGKAGFRKGMDYVYPFTDLTSRLRTLAPTMAEGSPCSLSKLRYWRGWYMIEMTLTSADPLNEMHLSFYSKHHAVQRVSLPFTVSGCVKRLVYLPFRANRLDLSSTQCKGTYQPLRHNHWSSLKWKSLRIKPVLPAFAKKRMAQRQAQCHRYTASNKSLSLLQAYEQTFLSLDPDQRYRQWQQSIEAPHYQTFCDHYQTREKRNVNVEPLEGLIIVFTEGMTQAALSKLKHSIDHALLYYNQSPLQGTLAIRVVYYHGSLQALNRLANARYAFLLPIVEPLLLTPQAVCEVALAIDAQPQVQLIYADCDYIDTNHKRFLPWFKPDWDATLLQSHYYLRGMVVFNTARLLAILRHAKRPFNQMSALSRAFTQSLNNKQSVLIVHIPWVLVHFPSQQSPHAIIQQQVRSIKPPNVFLPRVLQPHVTLIIPTKDQRFILQQCIESILRKTQYHAYDIIVVNNQSEDPKTLDYLATLNQQPRITVIDYDQPFNYSAINNYAAQQATGELLALINNDIEVLSPCWLDAMVKQAQNDSTGCVGAKLLYPNGQIQHAGLQLDRHAIARHVQRYLPANDEGYYGLLQSAHQVAAVTGAALLVKKSLYLSVGGLNETQLAVAYNDVDLCLKLQQKGYQIVWTPYALLIHHESLSRGEDKTPAKQQRLAREQRYMRVTWGNQAKRCVSPHWSGCLYGYF